jgi:hypothetical protein
VVAYPLGNGEYNDNNLGVGIFELSKKTSQRANITWPGIGNLTGQFPGAFFPADLKAFYVDWDDNVPTGLAFALVKTRCTGNLTSCMSWRTATGGDWYFVAIRYRFGSIYIQPKIVSVLSVPTTGGLSDNAVAVITSTMQFFVFDEGLMIAIRNFNGQVQVTNVTNAPPVLIAKSPLQPIWNLDNIIYFSPNGLVRINPQSLNIVEEKGPVPKGQYVQLLYNPGYAFYVANGSGCGRECAPPADLYLVWYGNTWNFQYGANKTWGCSGIACALTSKQSVGVRAESNPGIITAFDNAITYWDSENNWDPAWTTYYQTETKAPSEWNIVAMDRGNPWSE